MGGIVTAVPTILFSAQFACNRVIEGEFSKETLFTLAYLCTASTAVGVGLAAAAAAIFPVTMLGAGPAALQV
ncbi:hypothetical protein QUS22_04250 [Wolbachia pipientis]|nr:hypothetical protein [Wolbachia pipientis]